MEAHTEYAPLECELTLRDPEQSSLTVHAITLALTKQDDQPIECRLTFCVNSQLYQRINTGSFTRIQG